MKSVLISIQPKWCELIASGKKTVEVRKTRPKIETPFKCYIYMTKDKWYKDYKNKNHYGSGKVIGEFVCDRIGYVRNYGDMVDSYDCIASCLSANEIIEYAKDKNGNFVYTYGWHISGLVIYDKPKELREFSRACNGDCQHCEYAIWETRGYNDPIIVDCKTIRPPQSWRYVEGVEGE